MLSWTARWSNWSILKEINPWKDWWCSWSSNTLATWCEKLTHWKRPWCWERLKAGGDNRGWDSWMAPTQWTWVWGSSRRWWRTGKPGVLQSMGLQRVGHDWATHNNSNFYTAAHYLSSLTWIDVGLSLCILPLPLAHLVLLLSLSFHSCKMGLSRVPSAFNSPYKSMKVFGKLKRTLRTWIWQPIWMPPHSAAKCISVLASKMEA